MDNIKWEIDKQELLKEWYMEGDPRVRWFVCPACFRVFFTMVPGKKYCHGDTCVSKQWNRLQKEFRYRSRANRKCACCGKEFTPMRVDAKYCSNACKQKAYRNAKQ